MIDDFVSKNLDRSIAFTSMGQLLYLSSMKYMNIVIGNSSSGIIETPHFKIPTINIGDREKGRIRVANIIDCEPNEKEISLAIKKALDPIFLKTLKNLENPYFKKDTAKNIKNIIKDFIIKDSMKKVFFDQ